MYLNHLKVDDLDLALLIFLEGEESLKTEHLEANDIFKKRATEDAFMKF